jgi:hypothetical protein
MTVENDPELLKKYNLLYLEIIMRYRDYIETNENLSVAELPKLVTPEDESVVSFANSIKSTFSTYSFDQNFREAAEKAYSYIKNTISEAMLPIEFWLSPSQVIKSSAGDLFDKAVLLCSLLIALGNISTRVVVVTKPEERRFVVYCEYKEKIIAFDVQNGAFEVSSKEELLNKLKINEGEETTAYEFNDKTYSDLE